MRPEPPHDLLALAVVEGQYRNLGSIDTVQNQVVEKLDYHMCFHWVQRRHVSIAGLLPVVTKEETVVPTHAFDWRAVTKILYALVVLECFLVNGI